ncbi:MAG: MBL fold metallo-hydrolase [Candidatus Kaiserbacteria bacterium]|nr:MBL fold metallo-hydrolase [Candidatus Kaiserbacteria bacterium]
MAKRFVIQFFILCTAVAGYWWYVLVWVPLETEVPMVRVHFLDVGQGDSILIETPSGRQVLVDAGRDGAVSAALNHVMQASDKHIDALVMTHPDADHIGGFAAVLDQYDISSVIHSFIPAETQVYRAVMERVYAKEQAGKIAVHQVDRAQQFILDDVTLSLLWPLDRTVADKNAASVVLLVQYGDQQVLLTGDAPVAVEDVLFNVFPDLLADIELVKAGHHGSRTSFSQAMLEKAEPHSIVFSYGEGNPYKHPHHTVLNRTAAYVAEHPDARVYRTVDGTVSFCITKENTIRC